MTKSQTRIKLVWYLMLAGYLFLIVVSVPHFLFEMVIPSDSLSSMLLIAFAVLLWLAVLIFNIAVTYRDYRGRSLPLGWWLAGFFPLVLLVGVGMVRATPLVGLLMIPLSLLLYVKMISLREPLPVDNTSILATLRAYRPTWRGDPTLPASFILFYGLCGLFIGEGFVTAGSIVANIAGVENVAYYRSIFEASIPVIGDFRFYFYFGMAAVLWFFFRKFHWVVGILAAGAGIAVIEAYIAAQSPGFVSSLGAVVLSFVLGGVLMGGIIAGLPYALFQGIRRVFGERAVRYLIYIVLTLNLMTLVLVLYYRFLMSPL